MNKYFAYVRVSTARQGEGVSLQEQREAIERYAERNGLEIAEWFEEKMTAAKRGRPAFTRMLKLLQAGKASGIIIHKIDRSARNLKDWADLGELIDRGTEVHFVNESLDLQSRGGRLSADIQAVVAADYVRNLREETRKGFYGRLKQGIYPLPAPIGYLDKGRGMPKELDAAKAPLVRKAFELYATGRFNLDGLVEDMYRFGLRNRNGSRITRTGFSVILNNPFYVGLIRLRRTGETFQGAHQPLIRKSLFDRVRATLNGRTPVRVLKHDFLFRRLLTCKNCGYSLIGERVKGHAYYRCHTKSCPLTSLREEVIEASVLDILRPLEFSGEERSYLATRLEKLGASWLKEREGELETVRLQIAKVRDRLAACRT